MQAIYVRKRRWRWQRGAKRTGEKWRSNEERIERERHVAK
jgi:hypothetical protein